MQKLIRMNVDHGLFKRHQQWDYDDAPEIVRLWTDTNAIGFDRPVCSIVNELGQPYNKIKYDILFKSFDLPKVDKPKPEKPSGDFDKRKTLSQQCKGVKMDGTPCKIRMVYPNGYCFKHQAQAK